MILSALIVVICLVALFQPTTVRWIAAVAFASMVVVHDRLLGDVDGFAYYGSAALADLIVISLLHKLAPLSKMTLALQRLSIVSICTNGLGYLLWFAYAPAWPYDTVFIAVFAWAVWIMIRDLRHVGSPADDRGGLGLHRYTGPGSVLIQAFKGNSRC